MSIYHHISRQHELLFLKSKVVSAYLRSWGKNLVFVQKKILTAYHVVVGKDLVFVPKRIKEVGSYYSVRTGPL